MASAHLDLAFEDAEQLGFAEDQVFGSFDFDFGSSVFAVDDGVALAHAGLGSAAVVKTGAGANRDDLALDGALLGALGQVNPRRGSVTLLDGFDEHSIIHGFD